MLKHLLKKTVLFLLCLLALINLLLGYCGGSSILLTATVYTLLWLAGTFTIKKLVKKTATNTNLRLLFTALVCSLFTGELALRYVFKTNLQRQELDGGFFYTLPCARPKLQTLFRHYVEHKTDVQLNNYPPYSSRVKSNTEFSYLHQYNSLGLRCPEPKSDTNLLTIVALGDSYTEGSGTPQDSTWSQLLENELNQRAVCTKPIQHINGGIAGSDPIEEYTLLQKLLLPFHPGIVIVSINSTDITDVIKKSKMPEYGLGVSLPWWAFIYQFSYITRAVIQVVHPVNWLLLTPEQNALAEKQALEKIEQCIVNRYYPLSQQYHFKLVVALSPMLTGLRENNFRLQPLANALSTHPEIKTINFFEAFKHAKQYQAIEYDKLYWPIDGHHTPLGYKLMADTLTKEIEPVIQQLCSELTQPNTSL